MDTKVRELLSAFELAPECRDALEQLCRALDRHNSLPTLKALLHWWASVNRYEPPPRRAVAELYGRLAESASPESARAYCLEALDLMPGYAEALFTLERHVEGRERSTILRERYEAFLEWAPFHKQAPRIRQKLIDVLVEARDYDAALAHVRALPSRGVPPLEVVDSCEVKRACSVIPPPPSFGVEDAQGPEEIEIELAEDAA